MCVCVYAYAYVCVCIRNVVITSQFKIVSSGSSDSAPVFAAQWVMLHSTTTSCNSTGVHSDYCRSMPLVSQYLCPFPSCPQPLLVSSCQVLSPAKWVWLDQQKNAIQVYKHGDPHDYSLLMAGVKTTFYNGRKEAGRAGVSKLSMAFHCLSLCQKKESFSFWWTLPSSRCVTAPLLVCDSLHDWRVFLALHCHTHICFNIIYTYIYTYLFSCI